MRFTELRLCCCVKGVGSFRFWAKRLRDVEIELACSPAARRARAATFQMETGHHEASYYETEAEGQFDWRPVSGLCRFTPDSLSMSIEKPGEPTVGLGRFGLFSHLRLFWV